MLYYLLYSFHEHISVFNVVRYITFRTAYASITALLICLLLGPPLISWLKKFQIGQQIREDGPSGHQKKSGTPTMGGILILVSIIIPTLLWADLTNWYIWIALLSLLFFGAIGFLDDYFKVAKKRSLGLTARQKIALQTAFSLVVALGLIWLSKIGLFSTRLSVPFFKKFTPDMDLIIIGMSTFIPLIIFVIIIIVGSSNAVNLSDGLDGLAAGLVVITATALTALTYVTGHATFAEYLGLIKNVYASELAIFCGSMAGASLGFLWYNCHPAEIFMGDVGSMSLGGSIGTVAILIKQEFMLLFIGSIFVLEALSVILQVGSFKLRGKRIFKMAPMHHHFELSGWDESKVVIRLWIAAIIAALFSLTTLKLR